MLCTACPRNCKAERTADRSAGGFCKMPYQAVVARAALHKWEEPPISGTNGSGAVFFSGCSLHCVFCQNSEISHGGFGKTVTVARFIEQIRALERQGAHNINLVNPTHFVPFIREALQQYKPAVPVVYNTGGYDSVESLKSLEGLVDVYLPDLKFFDRDVSAKYAAAPDYFEKASAAVLEMRRQTGEDVFKNGLITRGLIVRHLVLPGNIDQSFKILAWMQSHLPQSTYVSLMCQYTPCGTLAQFKELQRRLTTAEYDRVINRFFDLGFTNGFMQARTSAEECYIPPFDLTGV